MSDLPRLLLCSFDVIPGPSGSSRRVTEYLKALPDRFSVVVLSAKTPDHSHIEKYQGARLLRVPVGSGDLASRIQAFERAVRRQLESEDYALAHFTDPFGGYALCELKADYGYRLIYEAQTFPSQELRYTHPQTEGDRRFLSKVRRQELFCLMNADLIVTGSQTTRSYIQSLGASEELIRVLRAPVDLGPYTPDVLGAPDGDPLRMMYLGSQVGWQGLTTLLRAVAQAAQQVPVRLTVVGAQHPDWQPHLDDLVKELGLKDRVEFQPPVHHDDLVKVLALADVGVLPLDDVERNRRQGGPLAKVSEYFAAGRPVLAADLPVTRELLPEGASVFFPPGDVGALAGRIVELARDIPRRVELGRRARAHAEEALDAGLIRGQLLDLYDSLLEKRSEPVATTSEDDLPAPTTVTGTPTNRLAALLPPESPRAQPPASAAPAEGASPRGEAGELPLVLGLALEEGMDTRLVKTEPDARPSEPPVVMGLPLREPAPLDSDTVVTEAPSAAGPAAAPTGRAADPERAGTAAAPSPAEAPPAPTPIIRAPADASREEAPQGSEAPSAPAAAALPADTEGREEPPAPTPVVRGPAEPEREETPTPTPALPVSAELEPTPSPTPIVRAPTSLEREEPLAPTPIVRVPSVLLSEEPPAPTPTPVVRGPAASLGEEPPAPTPIVPTRSVYASRSTSGRMETPAANATALPSSGHGEPPSGRTSRVESPPGRLPSGAFPVHAEGPAARTPSGGSASVPPEPASGRLPSGATPTSRVETPPGRTPSVGGASRSTSQPERPPPILRPGPADGERPPPILRPGSADAERPPIRGGPASSSTTERPPVLPPRAAAPPPVPRQRPPRLTPEGPPRLTPAGVTGSRPALPSSPRGAVPSQHEDEPEEISADEAQAIEDGDSGATPVHSRPHVDEPDEISSDEVEEAEVSATSAARLIDDDEVREAEPAPRPADEGPAPEPVSSSLNPWFAQLAHGYCPPEGIRFDRHTPPTTFPGRDDGTDPARLGSPSRTQGVVRGKSS